MGQLAGPPHLGLLFGCNVGTHFGVILGLIWGLISGSFWGSLADSFGDRFTEARAGSELELPRKPPEGC